MDKYVIGIDGGGTGSKGITADVKGNILSHFRGGATNYNGGKKEEIDANVMEVLEEASYGRKKSDCKAICIGSAGISNEDAVSALQDAVKKAGFKCPVTITADSDTAHAGALNNQEGIILIAGTGSICFAKRKDGVTRRVGGYGHLIDDEGSAYDISRRILRAVVRDIDRRGEPTVLTELVFEQLQTDKMEKMISWLYAKERTKKEIAYLAMLLGEAVNRKDVVAGEIVEEIAQALVELSVPAIEFMEKKTILAVSGSVLKFNHSIQEAFTRKLQSLYPEGFGTPEGLRIQDAENEADYGAVLLALDSIRKNKAIPKGAEKKAWLRQELTEKNFG